MMNKQNLDFLHARSIAIERAKEVMEGFCPDAAELLFEKLHLENDDCWLFFRNRDIVVPDHPMRIFADGAFAVGKSGQSLIVHDYFGDQVKLDTQMKKLSELFSKNQ